MKTRCLIFALLAALSATAQTNISVYRNDKTFNQIKLDAGEKISHLLEGEKPVVAFNDWISGPQEMPLSAVDSFVVRQVDVPAVYINLTNYPDATVLWDKELYLDATIAIDGNGYTDDLPVTSLQVKGRGNSTWMMPKKPFRLKFPKKTALCGMKKAKSFVLLNNYIDQSMMRNAIAMWVARRLGVPYANSMIPCNVFLNGHYVGAYTMSEKVGINSGSVDIDESTGMLFELSKEFDEKYKFRSKLGNLPVMVKDPDFDELYEDEPEGLTPEERLKLWQDDFNNAERMVYGGRGAEAFDIESAVNYILLYTFIRTNELNHPKSCYIHKVSLEAGQKYIIGPAWDFDVGFNFLGPVGNSYSAAGPNSEIKVIPLLQKLMETPEFKARYAERWKEFRQEMFPDLLEFFDAYAALIAASAKYDGLRWPTAGVFDGWAYKLTTFDFHTQASALRKWLIDRAKYLDNRIK